MDKLDYQPLMSEEEYRNHRGIANSDLGKLAVSPRWFHDYKYGDADGISSSGFHKGSLFDCKLLTPDLFSERYILQPEDLITPSSGNQKTFCEIIIEEIKRQTIGYEPTDELLMNAYSECYAEKDDKKILVKARALYDDLKAHIDFTFEAEGKEIYTFSDSQTINQMHMAVMGHPLARKLLVERHPKRQGLSQMMIFFGFRGVNCKSMLDRVVIDFEEKIIYLIDVKTTSKPLVNFHEAVERYRYHRQQAYYSLALQAYLMKEGFPFEDFQMVNVWAVIQTTGANECRIFPVPNDLIQSGMQEAIHLLDLYSWHDTHQQWDLTRDAYENGGFDVLGGFEPDEMAETMSFEPEVTPSEEKLTF